MHGANLTQLAAGSHISSIGTTSYLRIETKFYADKAGVAHEIEPYEELLKHSLLTKRHASLPVTDGEAYSITHTSFYISDFGFRDPCLAGESRERAEELACRMLDHCVHAELWDLTAELLITQSASAGTRSLRHPQSPEYRAWFARKDATRQFPDVTRATRDSINDIRRILLEILSHNTCNGSHDPDRLLARPCEQSSEGQPPVTTEGAGLMSSDSLSAPGWSFRRRSFRPVLINRSYTRLWYGQAISAVGDAVFTTTLVLAWDSFPRRHGNRRLGRDVRPATTHRRCVG